MADAFEMLRSHARNHNLKLTDVASGVLTGSLHLETVRPSEL
jgi:hypothetical protein